MESIPSEQHAWVVTRQGFPIKALAFKTDWPVPKKLEDNEVLVKIQAAALNPGGWKLMVAVPNFLIKRPHVAELDFAGVVVKENSTQFTDGEAVFGWIPADLQWKTQQGALAQYARVPSSALVKRPPNITPTQAAGITVAALTSYQALFHIAKLEADQTVFINGGSSSLGAYAIQFAKAKGAKVIATASEKNEDLVRELGADEFIDYTKKPLYAQLLENPPTTKYHVIYDAVGVIDPSLFTYSEKYLAPNGIFISSGPMPTKISIGEAWKLVKTLLAMFTPAVLGGINRRYSVIFTKNNPDDLNAIQKLVADGKVKPVVDSVYELHDALAAYDKIMTSRARGKVIVKIDPGVN
ncbi:Zinc-type alcohol dehydrogenase-like protein C16A3.02c [Psilocybe cubensis]|uniref:Zinc-type alcohol dehydrogenase-like protein C16A3.02c n=2 Tax=Psilocybe cubensis TaxID=181762 RepID=A0ACB8H7Y7_PSICU|nr:Zinc-type alcohol dehydrogenase-like protein C16A3.02c [Psilocybe cubensis]KAH9484026.1 Zinc-type alcohol dehydrogenase-like protein C16A3.02c [Psilocybe cubensis]